MEPVGDISDSKARVEKAKSKALMLYRFLAAKIVLVGDREVSYSGLKLFSLIS